MAESNYSIAENILSSIPAREQITKEIANDSGNIQTAVNASKTVKDKLAEKVQAVIGKDFEFKSLK